MKRIGRLAAAGKRIHVAMTTWTRGLALAPLLAVLAGMPAMATPLVSATLTEGAATSTQRLSPQPAIAFDSSSTSGYVIRVNPLTSYQTMDGVGASLTDSSAWLIWNRLGSAERDALMQSLFDTVTGIGLSLLRQPMGASDFSASGNYSYDDLPPGQTDPALVNFSIAHDQAYIIPLLQQARAANPALKVFALPWSPPAWMKSSGSMNGGAINTTDFTALANYFVKLVQGYQAQGIPVFAVNPQNEPGNDNPGYPTATLSAGDQASFIANHLGPALGGAGLSTKIVIYEHNWDNPNYPLAVLGNSAAAPYVYATAFHCYGGDVSAQSTVKNSHPQKGIWFTECSGSLGSDFGNDLVWNASQLLIGATRHWAQTVSLWNLALDPNGGPTNGGCANCRGVVTVDSGTTPVTIQRNVEYYVLGQLAKFVKPGAVRVYSNTFGGGSVESVAFRNTDGTIAVLVLNGSSSVNRFTIHWQGNSFNYDLAARSLVTFTWPDAATANPAISSSAWYNVVNQASNACVDADTAWQPSDVWTGGNGKRVQQWSCGRGQYNQEWQFRPTSGGYYQVVNRSSGKAWDVKDASGADGAQLQQWSYGGGNNQQWQPVALGNGYFRFVARHSGKCLAVPGASAQDGVQLVQAACDGSGAQAFVLSLQP